MLKLLALGFLLGVRHAFESDHLAAVTTFTHETKKLTTASKIGAWWGIGHATTLMITGLLLMSLQLTIPPTWATHLESVIGIMLILLGINLLLKIRHKKIHLHRHTHNGTTHAHLHSHEKTANHDHIHLKKSFLIGTLHGLAGSAALMLLVLGTVNTLPLGITYILIFGLGSIFGMAGISTLISLPFLATTNMGKTHTWIQTGAGMLTILIGIGMI